MKESFFKRLSQNFSFWESNLRFRGKADFCPLFPKPFPKLTEFWEWLFIIYFLFTGFARE
jgi:hypothetical protein